MIINGVIVPKVFVCICKLFYLPLTPKWVIILSKRPRVFLFWYTIIFYYKIGHIIFIEKVNFNKKHVYNIGVINKKERRTEPGYKNFKTRNDLVGDSVYRKS